MFEEKTNVLSLYSADNIATLKVGTPAQKYLRFIEHMLANEKIVNFIDPFIAGNDSSRSEFYNTYLPMVAEGATVNLFLARSEGSYHWKEIKQKAQRQKIELYIYPCSNKMHDRFITTSDSILNIGAGLLFYDSQKQIREVTTFAYQKKKKTSDKKLELEMCLAGGNVDSPQ